MAAISKHRGSQHETNTGDASASPVPGKKKALTDAGAHMLNAFSNKLQATVGSLTVPPDCGEVIEALELIKSLPLENLVVTSMSRTFTGWKGPLLYKGRVKSAWGEPWRVLLGPKRNRTHFERRYISWYRERLKIQPEPVDPYCWVGVAIAIASRSPLFIS